MSEGNNVQRYRSWIWCCLLLLSVDGELSAIGAAQEPSVRSPEWRLMVGDKFTSDTRSDYTIEGEVSWRPGFLQMQKGASLIRDVGASSEMVFELDFGKDVASTPLGFEIVIGEKYGAGCKLRFTFDPEAEGKSSRTFTYQSSRNTQRGLGTVDTEVELPIGEFEGLRVRVNHGVLKIQRANDQRIVLQAYLGNMLAQTTGCMIAVGQGQLPLSRFAIRSRSADPLVAVSRSQGSQLADGEAAHLRLVTSWRKGAYADAMQASEEALSSAKSVLGENHLIYVASLLNVATVQAEIGRLDRAAANVQAALASVRQQLGETHPTIAACLHAKAHIQTARGNYLEAQRVYEKVLSIRGALLGKSHPDYLKTLQNLAILQAEFGDYAKAASSLREVISALEQRGEKRDRLYLNALQSLSSAHDSMGNGIEAQKIAAQAARLSQSVFGDSHRTTLYALVCLGSSSRTRGDFGTAEEVLEKALSMTKVADFVDTYLSSTIHHQLGMVFFQTGDLSQAEQHLVASVRRESAGPSQIESLLTVGEFYAYRGDRTQADEYFQRAHASTQNFAEVVLPTLSSAQRAQLVRKFRPAAESTLSLLRASPDEGAAKAYPIVWQTKRIGRRLGMNLITTKERDPKALEKARELLAARRRLASVISMTPQPGQFEATQAIVNRLTDDKEKLERQLADVSPISKREQEIREASIKDLLSSLPANSVVVDFVRSYQWQYNGKDSTGAEGYDAFVLKPMQPGRAQLEEDNARVTWVPLGAAEPIDSLLSEWRGEIQRGAGIARRGSTSPDRRLRRLIWDRLEPYFDGAQTVIVIPDGALHELPWNALPGRSPGTYLIHDYAVTTAAFGQQLFGLLSSKPIREEESLLLAGGFDFDQRIANASPATPTAGSTPSDIDLLPRGQTLESGQREWRFLEGSVEEVQGIAEVWGDRGEMRTLTGANASEIVLARQLTRSRFVHLATHGFFDESGEVHRINLRQQSLFAADLDSSKPVSVATRNPLLMSGIVMAGANVPPQRNDLGLPTGEDGVLTAEEIVGMDLRRTEMVTLSACQTGLGDRVVGQGVMGLQSALHEAGVRTVIASLWKVDDSATQALMTEFYANLWQKKMSKLEALRQAQLKMLREYDPVKHRLRGLGTTPTTKAASGSEPVHPRYWAAFQLSGDWR